MKTTGSEKVLLNCLHEEWLSGGRCFTSPDTELWFKEAFGRFGESTADIFKRVFKGKAAR